MASGIVRMTDSVAQVRALDTLAHHRLADRETLEALTRLYPLAKSVSVQRAIAGILIRVRLSADRDARARSARCASTG